MPRNYSIAQLDDIEAVACLCGQARRAFVEDADSPASLHLVDISADARPHYHKEATEIYLVLEGTGHVELDGEMVSARPMTAIVIKPGCRHRGVGRLRIVNVVIPPFDPADEWFDE